MKSILLLAYYFYPYPGVGGNTWNKLAVALCRLGYTVHVVTVNWPKNKLAQHPDPNGEFQDKLIIHRIPARYPIALYASAGNRLLGFISRVWSRLINPIFFWDDISQHWKKPLLRKATKIIAEHDIKLVVATGYPFRINYFAALLKCMLPHIILVQHFRDPWADDEDRILSDRKKNWQFQLQRFSIEKADFCYAATQGLVTIMSENKALDKWDVLPSGCDPDSIKDIDDASPSQTDDGTVIFTYLGNVACGRFELVEQFVECLRSFDGRAKLVYVGMHADRIRSHFPSDIQNGLIEVNAAMPQKDALQKVVNGDWALQLNSQIYPYLVSTKIYEYGMLKTPTLSINYGGDIERLIDHHSLGVSVNLNSQKLMDVVQKIVDREILPDFHYNIESFTFASIARKLDERFTKLL